MVINTKSPKPKTFLFENEQQAHMVAYKVVLLGCHYYNFLQEGCKITIPGGSPAGIEHAIVLHGGVVA